MGWHVLTAVVSSVNNGGNPVYAPVEGIQYQIKSSTAPGLTVSVQDINCVNAIFTKVGDSCSVYFLISYGPNPPNQKELSAEVVFAPVNYTNIQASLYVTDTIHANTSVSDYRVVLPIESAYYQASNLQANPQQYQILSLENGFIKPFQITNIVTPTNPVFTLMHRTTGGTDDPYYGAYSECALESDSSLNQVSELDNLTESCIQVYQASESAPAPTESASISLSTNSDMFFPIDGDYILQADYNFTSQFNWESTTLSSNSWLWVWDSVTYGNGTFVAINFASVAAATLDGGNTWTQSTLANNEGWCSVAYGNNLFVAISIDPVSSNSYIAVVSPDGVHWTQASLPAVPLSHFWIPSHMVMGYLLL